MCSENRAVTQEPWTGKRLPWRSFSCVPVGLHHQPERWAHPCQLCLLPPRALVLAQLKPPAFPSEVPQVSVSSVYAAFGVRAFCLTLQYCILVRETRMRGTITLKTSHLTFCRLEKKFKKISEIVKSQFEAWNKAFQFLGFWVLFSSSLAFDLSNSSFWNLETLFYSNTCFLPIISLSMLFFPPAFFQRSTREHHCSLYRKQEMTYSKPNESPHSGLNLQLWG